MSGCQASDGGGEGKIQVDVETGNVKRLEDLRVTLFAENQKAVTWLFVCLFPAGFRRCSHLFRTDHRDR